MATTTTTATTTPQSATTPTLTSISFSQAFSYNHYNERDIDRYHWNTAKFKTLWRTKFAVLMARERGRIGSDAALGDMPKRL
eukprot:COSAG05_NODE_604_length_8399_cov_6.936145_1_plen_81_part_10